MAVQYISLIKNVKAQLHPNAEINSSMVGSLTFTKQVIDDVVSVTCQNLATGLLQTSFVGEFSSSLEDASFTLEFKDLGIIITGLAAVDATHPLFDTDLKRSVAIADAICNNSTNVRIRSAMPVKITIPFLTNKLNAKSLADLSLGDYKGWLLYKTPSASELAADGKNPLNSWQPYYGDWSDISIIDTETVDRIKTSNKKPLMLPGGTVANQFKYTWGEWTALRDTFKTKKYTGDDASLRFVLQTRTSKIEVSRLSAYVNSIYVNTSYLTIDQENIDFTLLQPTLKVGDVLTIRYSKYEPTKAELEFDPDSDPASDNPLLLQEYKYDYQYTVKNTRDDSGNLIGTKYYFWVTNKNIAGQGKNMSLQQAQSQLNKCSNPYAVLQNIKPKDGVQQYDQFIGVGLNRYITQDDMYKVRFTRDHILRDDPKNIDLKNIHTEWALMREAQKTKIPEQLWVLLTNAACGYDLAGNPIPSLSKIAYDERNGTRTRYGFGEGQAFVDSELAIKSIIHAILNTSVTTISPAAGGIIVPDPIEFIDFSKIEDYFSDATAIRKTMSDIWSQAKATQINEIFFTVMNDALSENYEFTDIFKTSMIAAHSIRLFSTLGGAL